MQYEKVSSSLKVHFEAVDLDLLQLGILNSSLHAILNHVAMAIYDEANDTAEKNGEPKILDHIPQNLNRDDVLVRARVERIQQGSVIYELQPIIAAVFNRPGAVAIAQNLVSNVLWAIALYGSKITGLIVPYNRNFKDINSIPVPATTARKRIRPRVERLVKHLKQSGNGGKITFRSGEEELIIEFYRPSSRGGKPNKTYKSEGDGRAALGI